MPVVQAAALVDLVAAVTSAVAEGKLMVARNKGERVPEGWIVDATALAGMARAASA